MTHPWYGIPPRLSDFYLKCIFKGAHAEPSNGDAEGLHKYKGPRNLRTALERFRTLKAVSRGF